jgi:hypothetical protein
MGFFIFGLGIIIASQNLQIDITQEGLVGVGPFSVLGSRVKLDPRMDMLFSLGF